MTSDLHNFYDTNIALLEKNHPYAWKNVTESTDEEVGEVIQSPTGKLNLKVQNSEGQESYLHDPNDPDAEVPHFLDMIPPDSTGFVNLIGMGLGYTALALVQQRPALQKLVIYDLSPKIFRQALHLIDLTPLLSDNRVTLCISPNPPIDEILSMFSRTLQLESIHTLKHLPSFTTAPEDYEKLYDNIFAVVNKYNLGGSTTLVLGDKFIENRLQHLQYIHHHQLLENLKNKFRDIPAFIVAGGPSLNKNVAFLKKAKGKAVIIAVDGAFPVLQSNGISPDFVTTIDPHPSTFEKLAPAAPSAKNTSLVCMSWANGRIPKTFPADDVFWCFAGSHIERWINSLVGGKILTMGAATVAHLNLTTALVLGCSPITFVGQDLSYSIDSSHAKDTALTNQEEVDKLLKEKDKMIWVKGVTGEKVPTIRTFLDMKDHFERVIAANTSPKYINATAEGVHINGADVWPLEDVIIKYCTTDVNISEITKRSTKETKQTSSMALIPPLKDTLKKIKDTNRIIQKSDFTTDKALKEIARLENQSKKYKSFASLPKFLQKQIHDIDLYHKKIDRKKIIWEILNEITMEGLRHSERMKQQISLLEGDPEKYLEWLSKNLHRLDMINKVRADVLKNFSTKLNKVLKHYKEEQALLKETESSDTTENLLKLVKFYFDSGLIVLAQPFLNKLQEIAPDSALTNFYQGSTAAINTDFDKAEYHFSKAKNLTPSISEQIEKFRERLGTECLECAEEYRAIGPETFKKLLLKGLRYCPNHPKIRVELSALAKNDIARIGSLCAANTPEESHRIIKSWNQDLDTDSNLSTCIANDQVGLLYYYHSQMMLSENDSQCALSSLIKGLTYTPNMAEIHFALTEVLFSLNEYDRGINHLNRAIEITPGYAHYWENIGDHLFQAENYHAALTAYENCFKFLPEHSILLKKMSDCYLATEQIEAAHEALKLFKERLKTASQETGQLQTASGQHIYS